MDFWARLELEPTQDVRVIKRAYAKQLRMTHPEDDPDGFQLLRSAYEQALKAAKELEKEGFLLSDRDQIELRPVHRQEIRHDEDRQTEQLNNLDRETLIEVDAKHDIENQEWLQENEADVKPVYPSIEQEHWVPPSWIEVSAPAEDLSATVLPLNRANWVSPSWMEALSLEGSRDLSDSVLLLAQARGILEDIFRRPEITVWEEWTQREELWRLDVKYHTGTELLQILVEYPYMPKAIWRILNEFFGWTERQDELRALLSDEIADRPTLELERAWELRYDTFDPEQEVDYETFIRYRDTVFQRMLQGEWRQVSPHIDAAMELYADDPDMLLLAGKFRLWNREEMAAEMLFERLIELVPESIDGLLHRARLLENAGHLELSVNLYNKILELHPNHLDALNGLARYHQHHGDDAKAIHLLQRIVSIHPFDFEAQIALIELNLALVEAQKKTAEDEKDWSARKELQRLVALSYVEMDEDEQLLRYMAEIHMADKLDEGLYVLWAQACIRMEKNEEALEILKNAEMAAIEAEGDIFAILFERGQLHLEMGNSPEAILDLDKSTQLNPSHAGAWHSLAIAHHRQEQNMKCIYFSDKAIELDPHVYAYRSLRAFCYYINGRYEEALVDYEHVTLDDSDHTMDWFRKGFSHLKRQQYAEALQSLKVSQTFGCSTNTPYYLAVAHARLGEGVQALEEVRTFRRENPEDPDGPLLEGDILREQGRVNEALNVYRNGLNENPGTYELIRMVIVCVMESDVQKRDDILNRLAEEMSNFDSIQLWGILFITRYHVESHSWERALSWVEVYIDGEPSENIDPHIWLYAGIAAYRMGDLNQALLDLDKAYRGGLEGDVCSYLSMVYYDIGNMDRARIYAEKAVREQPEHPDYVLRWEAIVARAEQRGLPFWRRLRKSKPAYELWPSRLPLQHLMPDDVVSLHFV
ncbi:MULTISPECIES: J domain-containing protein [unclassified Paenibacillus]|uniref:J domain-containing protein n=1 Tax=unclassified Paenibacillus TaxID=185978 RepID=UPI0008D57898|nr:MULTISPECIES: J domain-containing protein [unclassified Paenibacillus]QLG38242.1 tetratricopeptide repeat protein [Paenibacillus sp. E222]SEO67827.1 Tetratricopeptide repeat-containing protein [Paenibacillus sp. OK076]